MLLKAVATNLKGFDKKGRQKLIISHQCSVKKERRKKIKKKGPIKNYKKNEIFSVLQK